MTLVKPVACTRLFFAMVFAYAITGASLLTTTNSVYAKDSDLVGYELYQRKDYGSAAEVFESTDWRGVSLYRSAQWWRAAEAFVRGNDAASFHNLGNTYVHMGYFALALEAYQQALQHDPNFEDAAFNANLMKQLIALKEKNEDGQGLLQPESLGEVTTDDENTGNTGSPEGGEQSEASDGETDETTSSGEQTTADRAVQAESGPAAQSDENSDSNPGDQGGSSVTGIESQAASEQNASGNSESANDVGKARSAGIRTQVEAEQATEQWLNRIEHNPILFLQKHIELETRRRRAAGQQAAEGGDGW